MTPKVNKWPACKWLLISLRYVSRSVFVLPSCLRKKNRLKRAHTCRTYWLYLHRLSLVSLPSATLLASFYVPVAYMHNKITWMRTSRLGLASEITQYMSNSTEVVLFNIPLSAKNEKVAQRVGFQNIRIHQRHYLSKSPDHRSRIISKQYH